MNFGLTPKCNYARGHRELGPFIATILPSISIRISIHITHSIRP